MLMHALTQTEGDNELSCLLQVNFKTCDQKQCAEARGQGLTWDKRYAMPVQAYMMA